jgi:hypothetical protein
MFGVWSGYEIVAPFSDEIVAPSSPEETLKIRAAVRVCGTGHKA